MYLDVVPTYRFYRAISYDLGRASEALRSPSAADAYRAFLALGSSDDDPLVADARRHLAALARAPEPAATPARTAP